MESSNYLFNSALKNGKSTEQQPIMANINKIVCAVNQFICP